MALNRVTEVKNRISINNVLLSVSDKTGLETLVKGLVSINPHVRLYSTGGTYNQIHTIFGEKSKKHLVQVSDYTGQPEMQGGLVKTLDFKIYLGLLSESFNPDHKKDLERAHAITFDMVIVNLYPFEETIATSGVTLEDGRANIDIGGPTMLRASAKNYLRVASVCDPKDYPEILSSLESGKGTLDLTHRFELAKKTFAHTANYDGTIAKWLATNPSHLNQIYNFPEGV